MLRINSKALKKENDVSHYIGEPFSGLSYEIENDKVKQFLFKNGRKESETFDWLDNSYSFIDFDLLEAETECFYRYQDKPFTGTALAFDDIYDNLESEILYINGLETQYRHWFKEGKLESEFRKDSDLFIERKFNNCSELTKLHYSKNRKLLWGVTYDLNLRVENLYFDQKLAQAKDFEIKDFSTHVTLSGILIDDVFVSQLPKDRIISLQINKSSISKGSLEKILSFQKLECIALYYNENLNETDIELFKKNLNPEVTFRFLGNREKKEPRKPWWKII